MYVGLGQTRQPLTKLPQDPAFIARIGNLEPICEGVHAAGVIGAKGTESFTECLRRAAQLHLSPNGPMLSPEATAQKIAADMAPKTQATMANGGPNWLLWGGIGAVVLVGGAWLLTRK